MLKVWELRQNYPVSVSHFLIVVSLLTLRSAFSPAHLMFDIVWSCPINVRMQSHCVVSVPFSGVHILIVKSWEEVANMILLCWVDVLLLNLTSVTPFVWPFKVASSSPLSISHIFAVQSSEPVTHIPYCACIWTDVIESRCCESILFGFEVFGISLVPFVVLVVTFAFWSFATFASKSMIFFCNLNTAVHFLSNVVGCPVVYLSWLVSVLIRFVSLNDVAASLYHVMHMCMFCFLVHYSHHYLYDSVLLPPHLSIQVRLHILLSRFVMQSVVFVWVVKTFFVTFGY